MPEYAPSPLSATDKRFGVLGNAVWLFLPAVADPATGPDEAEINAGTVLQCTANDISGFTVSPTFTDTPDLCNIIDGKVFDGSTVDDSSITFYASSDDDDAKGFFAPLQTGFIMHAPYGLPLIAGDPLSGDLWPVTVGTVTSVPAMRGASMVSVSFAPLSPTLDFDIPVPTA
jgi:hypothetical protein